MNDGEQGSGAQWYIHIAPETFGPYTVPQIAQYVVEGRVTANTQVVPVGSQTWVRAGDQAAFASLFQTAPKPPAPPPRSPAAPAVTPVGGASSQALSWGKAAAGQAASQARSEATQVSTSFQSGVAQTVAEGQAAARALAAPASMAMMDAVRICFRMKYADFEGRARRAEYWWFTLFMFVIFAVLGIFATILTTIFAGGNGGIGSYIGSGALAIVALIVILGSIVPGIAVTVRRLHDRGWSGWWLLGELIPIAGGIIALVLLVNFFMRGTVGPNKYGDDPLGD